MDYVLTLYADDDATPYVEFGTAAAHARPYLHLPDEFAEAEIDLLNGRARIGRMNIRIIDPQTGSTQAERFVTGILGSADGYSLVNGRRARLASTDGVLVQDGICAGATLSDTFAGFSFALEDFRARGIKVSAYSRTGTTTLLPRGVLDGWGRQPDGGYLAPPTEPLVATYRSFGADRGVFDLSALWTKGKPLAAGGEVPAALVVTPEMQAAAQIRRRDTLAGPAWEWNAQVLWRAVGGTAWTPIIPDADLAQTLFSVVGATHVADDGQRLSVQAVHELNVLGSNLPPSGPVEVVVLYTGPASEAFPYHFEGTWGEHAVALLRGDHSTRSPRIPYDEAALLAIEEPVLIRQTEPVEDLREHFESYCKALGIAPALNSAGEVFPVRATLPPDDATLAQLDDTNCQPIPGWEHPISDAVTVVDLTYPRYYRIPPEKDPEGRRSAGDTLARVEQEVRVEPLDDSIVEVMGEQVHDVDAWPFGAIGGTEGEPITGDVDDEAGFQLAYGMGHQMIDRMAYGGQSSFVRAMRDDISVAGLRVGDWVIDARSWAPNYAEGERGRNHLAQVLSIRDLNPAWREMRLLDAAPYANPLAQPTIGAPTASDEGVVSVPVTAIPAGAEARVDFAISETMPPTGSGLWTFLGRTASVGTITSPPLPAGDLIWIRGRSEAVGRRPSAWTTPQSVETPHTPRIRRAAVRLAADGAPVVTWTANAFALGVRVYYDVHGRAEADPVLYVDAVASAGELRLEGVEVRAGEVVTVDVEPWTEWDGSAVGGTAGVKVRAVSGKPTDRTAYQLNNVERVPASAPGKARVQARPGALVDAVWWAYDTFSAPLTRRHFDEVGEQVAPLAADGVTTGETENGEVWVEVDEPHADKLGALVLEPRYEDADGELVVFDHPESVVRFEVHAIPPLIGGWIDAKYEAGVVNVYAGAEPTISALPVSVEIREGSKEGPILAAAKLTSQAAAKVGLSPATHPALGGRTPAVRGKKSWWAKFTNIAGNVEWRHDSLEAPEKPRILKFRQTAGASSLVTNIHVLAESPVGRDLTLRVWTNKGGTDHADPDGSADAEIAVPFAEGEYGTQEIGPSDSAALENVPVWPGRGKKVYFELLDDLGFSTGVVDYTLISKLDLVGADGELIADAMKQPAQFASTIRPPHVGPTPPDEAINIWWLNTSLSPPKLARWNGSDWTYEVDGEDLIAESVIAGKIAVGAVGALQIASKEIYGYHLNIADVYLTGIAWSGNGSTSISWTAGTVDFQANTYEIAAGSTTDEIVWWDRTNPSGFQTAADPAALEAAGYDDADGDRIIALNEGGSARVVWNGTRIYGGHITTRAIRAQHLVVELDLEVGQEIRSASYVEGAAGWMINGDGQAELNEVVVRGLVYAEGGVFAGDIEIGDSLGQWIALMDGSTQVGAIRSDISGYLAFPGVVIQAGGSDSPDSFVHVANGVLGNPGYVEIVGGNSVDITGPLVSLGSSGGSLAFFGEPLGGSRPNITGSRGGNAALASLLTSLAGFGLITNSTT